MWLDLQASILEDVGAVSVCERDRMSFDRWWGRRRLSEARALDLAKRRRARWSPAQKAARRAQQRAWNARVTLEIAQLRADRAMLAKGSAK